MKKLLLLSTLSLTIVNFNANATEPFNPLQSVNNNQVIQSQAQSLNNTVTVQGGSVSGISNSVNVDSDTKLPVSSAIAPSVGTANDCQIATPSSVGGSIIILSTSFTTGVHYNDICYAYKRGQYDVADKMMCARSADYAKANASCAK